jgi:hypothetical protein
MLGAIELSIDPRTGKFILPASLLSDLQIATPLLFRGSEEKLGDIVVTTKNGYTQMGVSQGPIVLESLNMPQKYMSEKEFKKILNEEEGFQPTFPKLGFKKSMNLVSNLNLIIEGEEYEGITEFEITIREYARGRIPYILKNYDLEEEELYDIIGWRWMTERLTSRRPYCLRQLWYSNKEPLEWPKVRSDDKVRNCREVFAPLPGLLALEEFIMFDLNFSRARTVILANEEIGYLANIYLLKADLMMKSIQIMRLKKSSEEEFYAEWKKYLISLYPVPPEVVKTRPIFPKIYFEKKTSSTCGEDIEIGLVSVHFWSRVGKTNQLRY